ncbi:MAG TPA: hypothetical protein VM325_13430 [Alphaproteobacteria bacterium]|nr:hypothetical protein [Alphaproteobacteria bacterium]
MAVRRCITGEGCGDPDASYTSLKADDGVSFTHIAHFRTEEALKRFQSQPHFETFNMGLPPRCSDGAKATKVSLVATTDR